VNDDPDAPLRAVFRQHPVRMLAWYLAEYAVNALLGLQDSIEAKNRASLEIS
jgi:hypothetical protein